ncbi:hypothetical protein KY290_007965 [Solanum tuberosum]|uniref:Uncharacterized protein n=1 Tax=Solanum tuberosum TaxID=4113 RepID=A0ABQ7W737_SOLTU|nr:hypothetical protein KY290_007965 [Solanum tuberosum]
MFQGTQVVAEELDTQDIKGPNNLKLILVIVSQVDTVDYAQQDNNSPNDANSKDVDQQATKINAGQEHYGDVEENVLSDQEVSESLPPMITNQKCIQLYVELNEVLPITYEDKKNIQSDEETTGQSHNRNQEGGQLIDELKEDMIIAQREEQELQDQSSSEDCIVARHGEKQKL